MSAADCVCVSDKNLSVSISGDVDEAKALSKPPEDSQGKNVLLCKSFFNAFASWISDSDYIE